MSLLGALALAGASLVLAPALEARGGHGGGGGGSHGGGGGSHGGGGSYHGGGGSYHGGGGSYSRGGGSYSRSGSGNYSRSGGYNAARGWTTHRSGGQSSGTQGSGTHYSGSNTHSGGGSSASHSAYHGGGGYHGGGYYHGGHYYGHPGYGHYWYGYPGIYWGWNTWGWGWGWGWAPYWSTWWWGGPWGGNSIYVAPGSVDVGVRNGRYAIVKTDIEPEEAQLYLDGKYIGSADDFDGMPDFLYLGKGTYHFEARLPNYQTYATELDVTPGQQVRIAEKLKLEQGKSALDAFPPESKGTPLGRVFTKGGDSTAEAAPRGDDGWSDRESAPAYRDHEMSQQVPDDERMDARVAPPSRSNRGRIKFRVTPEDAAVYMDDRYLGAADDLAASDRGVVAEPGTHSITVTRPGYKSKTVEITARAGSPVDVVVELEK